MMQAIGSESRANEYYEYPNTELSLDINNAKGAHIEDQEPQVTSNQNPLLNDQPVPQ